MKAGGSATYTIPSCITPGYYLVRHEIIALHASYQYPGAQFYPGCHQLKVTGGGSKTPSGLVAFPGAYKGSDPGITYDAYKGMCDVYFTCAEIGLLTESSSNVYRAWTSGVYLLDVCNSHAVQPSSSSLLARSLQCIYSSSHILI